MFWVLFISSLLASVRLCLESEFHQHTYQWLPMIWVSISTKSLTLHYSNSGQAMHPHHNREMEIMYTVGRSSISPTAKRLSDYHCSWITQLHVLNSSSPGPTWSDRMLYALAHAQNKSTLEIWVAASSSSSSSSSSHLYLAYCLYYKLYVATAWFYMLKRFFLKVAT